MRVLFSKVLILLVGFSFAGSSAADDNLWLGVRAGTLGLGVEATWRPIDWLDLRAGVNLYDLQDSGAQAGINYDADLQLETYYLTGNFRFPLSPFRLTVGAYSNSNQVTMVSRDSSTFEIGDTTYTSADVGSLSSSTTFSSTSPYAGIGFDFELFRKLGMNLDIGVLWQGEPQVSLEADGLLADDPTFLAQLEAERLQLVDEMDNFKAYPVISLGLNFNFW